MNYKTLFRKSSWLFIAVAVSLPLISWAAVNLTNGIVPCGSKTGNTTACTLSDFVNLADNLIYFALYYLAAPLAVLSMAIGGILMITAAGDTGQLERGKSIFYNTVIGFLIAFGAYLIVKAILSALVSDTTVIDKLKNYINF